jgi:hypothetical protein
MCRELMDVTDTSALSATTFGVIRSILESFGDLRALACLVEASLASDDVRLLASTTDTLNTHALAFTVLGVLNKSIDRLMERHRTLRRGILDRTSLLAYMALIERFPERVLLTSNNTA